MSASALMGLAGRLSESLTTPCREKLSRHAAAHCLPQLQNSANKNPQVPPRSVIPEITCKSHGLQDGSGYGHSHIPEIYARARSVPLSTDVFVNPGIAEEVVAISR